MAINLQCVLRFAKNQIKYELGRLGHAKNNKQIVKYPKDARKGDLKRTMKIPNCILSYWGGNGLSRERGLHFVP